MGFRILNVGRTPLNKDNQPNQIQVDHSTVSRSHLSVFINEEDEIFITDLQSANGTFVNGNRIHGDYQLKKGDILKLGMAPPVKWTRWLDATTLQEIIEHTGEEQPLETAGTYTKTIVPDKRLLSGKNLTIAVLVLLLICVSFLLMVQKNEMNPSESKLSSAYTIDDLKTKSGKELNELAEKQVDVVNIPSGEELVIDDKTYILTVEDNKLTKAEEKNSSSVVSGKSPSDSSSRRKDTDGDGIKDYRDPCPNDKLNKCRTPPPPPSPAPQDPVDPAKSGSVIPKDVKSIGHNVYANQAMLGGETVVSFFKRISPRSDIKALGPNNKLGTISEICSLNMVSERDTLKGGTWVKFKVY